MKRVLFLISLVAAAAAAGDEVRLTGRLLDFNGTREVPRGLFGVHAVTVTPERVREWGIEADRKLLTAPSAMGTNTAAPLLLQCFFDRYQPALAVTRPRDYKAVLETLGTDCGRASATSAVPRWIEFWNEPYLNWGRQPGVNYDGAFYDSQDVTPGTPMTLRGEDRPVPGLVWTSQVVAVESNGQIHYVATRYMPAGTPAGTSFVWRGKSFLTDRRPWGRDVTQSNFWAGEVNRAFYEAMLPPFARALKAADSNVTLVAGWGFHLHQDGWAAWSNRHRPLIDLAWPWIDGIGEHHYGGDTRLVAGSYETAWAYALTAHGKRLRFFNTEAGGMIDPEQAGVMKPKAEGARAAEGALIYMVRDILYLVAACPDKAASRFAHEADRNGGDELAFKLLKPLRGRLMEVETTQPDVWCAAAVETGRVGLVLFNDSRQAQSVTLSLAAPSGTAWCGGGSLRLERDGDRPLLRDETVSVSGTVARLPLTLKPREPATVWLDLAGSIEGAETVRVTQVPAARILTEVRPGPPVEMSIAIPSNGLARTREVRLRVVLEGVGRGDRVACTVNGHRLTVQVRGSGIQDWPVPMTWLGADNRLQFEAPLDSKGGYRLCAVSLLLTEPSGL